MQYQKTAEEFKKANNISDDDWLASQCVWDELVEIANDFLMHSSLFSEMAEFFARIIQKFPGVHSVRWRVKDVDHLLEKIVRKRALKEKKYQEISKLNYSKIITDLIGIRALHLFKEDCLSIDRFIRDTWKTEETPVVYIRHGDEAPKADLAKESGFKVKHHPAGYRSIHYVVSNSSLKKKIFAEIQVRTIFEEGWSEIDHRVRYPNHLNDELVAYFLGIFNRMAGSADEMGSFVKNLASSLEDSKSRLDALHQEKKDALQALDESVAKLEQMREKSEATQAALEQLKADARRLRRAAEMTHPSSTPASLRKKLEDAVDKKNMDRLAYWKNSSFKYEAPQVMANPRTQWLAEKLKSEIENTNNSGALGDFHLHLNSHLKKQLQETQLIDKLKNVLEDAVNSENQKEFTEKLKETKKGIGEK
jgi:putative GTP pyrophosphokinase